MVSFEGAVMCLESQAVSAQVTKHFVTIFCRTCSKLLSQTPLINSCKHSCKILYIICEKVIKC